MVLAVVGVPALFAAVVGVEVFVALSREYEATDPAMEIGGMFGPAEAPPLTFVVLGDSTAAGVGAGDAAHAYPTLLAERLAATGRRVRLVDLGVSGARTHDVLVSQLPQALEAKPDLLLVVIGANDATHFTSLGGVREDMMRFLRRLRSAGVPVVVAGVPDMRVAAFLEPLRSVVSWRGRAVDGAIRSAASDAHAPYIPLADRTGHFFAEDPERYYSKDLFHPGPAGYARWAEAMVPELLRALPLG